MCPTLAPLSPPKKKNVVPIPSHIPSRYHPMCTSRPMDSEPPSLFSFATNPLSESR